MLNFVNLGDHQRPMPDPDHGPHRNRHDVPFSGPDNSHRPPLVVPPLRPPPPPPNFPRPASPPHHPHIRLSLHRTRRELEEEEEEAEDDVEATFEEFSELTGPKGKKKSNARRRRQRMSEPEYVAGGEERVTFERQRYRREAEPEVSLSQMMMREVERESCHRLRAEVEDIRGSSATLEREAETQPAARPSVHVFEAQRPQRGRDYHQDHIEIRQGGPQRQDSRVEREADDEWRSRRERHYSHTPGPSRIVVQDLENHHRRRDHARFQAAEEDRRRHEAEEAYRRQARREAEEAHALHAARREAREAHRAEQEARRQDGEDEDEDFGWVRKKERRRSRHKSLLGQFFHQ